MLNVRQVSPANILILEHNICKVQSDENKHEVTSLERLWPFVGAIMKGTLIYVTARGINKNVTAFMNLM